MCRIVMQAIEEGNAQVIEDVKRIAKYNGEGVLPKTPQELCNQVFTTIYMGMKKQSSRETRQRAKDLSEAIGSYHVNLDIDDIYEAQKNLVVSTVGFEPRFKVEGGTVQENLTLQCLQARIRMVTAYVSRICFCGARSLCADDGAGVWTDSPDRPGQTRRRKLVGAWECQCR
jgi:NAD+ synthase (glutamine-hydrolysing)